MAFSRAQILFLACCALLWGVLSCSYASGSASAPAASGESVSADQRVHVDATVEDIWPQTSRTIYRVPKNRFLILTDLETFVDGGAFPELCELNEGRFTIKRARYFISQGGYHSSSGMVFQPGSEVVLRDAALQGGLPADIGYTFSGYLLAQ